MHVKFDNRVGLEANHRITDREKILLQGLNVEGVDVDLLAKKLKKKLGTIAVGHYTIGTEGGFENRGCGRGGQRRYICLGNLLAVKYAVEAVHYI